MLGRFCLIRTDWAGTASGSKLSKMLSMLSVFRASRKGQSTGRPLSSSITWSSRGTVLPVSRSGLSPLVPSLNLISPLQPLQLNVSPLFMLFHSGSLCIFTSRCMKSRASTRQISLPSAQEQDLMVSDMVSP